MGAGGGRTHRELLVVQQAAVLGAAETQPGVEVAVERHDICERQEQEAMAVESHGPFHLQGGPL